MRRVIVDFADSPCADDAVALANALCARTGAELLTTAPVAVAGEGDLIVGQRLPEEATAPFALAPAGLGAAPPRLEQVAVGCDGSRESARALELAATLARRLDGALTILGVVEPVSDLDGPGSGAAAEEERIGRHLDRALEAIPADLAAEARLLTGAAAETLVAAAVALDLIVLGSRSHFGPRARMRPGSVAAAVATVSPRPTVIATA